MTNLAEALPIPVPSEEARLRLATRRSAPAQALIAPGPDKAQIDDILRLGARTPDHGKLFPWRFVVMGPRSRAGIAERLGVLAEVQGRPAKDQAVLVKLTSAPVTILVIFSPVDSPKIPLWEQQLSAGAVCMNLEHAANAHGFSASWITDWYSYDASAVALFDLADGERIAGFIHMGSISAPTLERERPTISLKATFHP